MEKQGIKWFALHRFFQVKGYHEIHIHKYTVLTNRLILTV